MGNPRAARRWGAGRAGLRQILAQRLGTSPARVPLVRGRRGKPEIAGSDLRFNKADSGEVAMVALCRGREVGLDLEAHRELRRAEPIARRFFAPEEQAQAASATGFFDIWTTKEAVLKCDGGGLGSIPMASFACPVGGGPVAGRWWVLPVAWRSGWSVAVALAGTEPAEVSLSCQP